MIITLKTIKELDLLVERADYGGLKDDLALASRVSDLWPDLEVLLRQAVEARSG